jgi:hypothetical protein
MLDWRRCGVGRFESGHYAWQVIPNVEHSQYASVLDFEICTIAFDATKKLNLVCPSTRGAWRSNVVHPSFSHGTLRRDFSSGHFAITRITLALTVAEPLELAVWKHVTFCLHRKIFSSTYLDLVHKIVCMIYYICLFNFFTYDHRTLKTRLPVRSALFKQRTGGLVVRWVTTSEYPLLYVFGIFVERDKKNVEARVM